ncbi:hypothetical protein R1flu_019756 [Riccia fluitans]|uniref:Hflx-type G domain-containing protein n=1 Tax=Riccia fluitans TaxID=41844 RepID=A0ABD1ZJJ5_9MARC
MTRMGLKSVWASGRSLVRLLIDPAGRAADYPAVEAATSWQKKSFSVFARNARVPVEELATARTGAPRIQPPAALKAKLLEGLRLADSLEDPRHVEQRTKEHREPSPYVLVQDPPRVHAGSYFGPGTIRTVLAHIHIASTKGNVDAVFVNAPLSGVQQRNLEDAWGKPVLDRVGLIIEIFGAHAQSKAAKLQVELASLNYHRSRLVRARGKGGARLGFGAGGEAEVVSARGRATGAIGGAGETEIQLQRRRISTRKHRLKSLLAEVDRTQTLHRLARIREGFKSGFGKRLPVVAVVGYTNAGKSSLVAVLSRSDMYVDDKLFATLDTRSRRVVLPSGFVITYFYSATAVSRQSSQALFAVQILVHDRLCSAEEDAPAECRLITEFHQAPSLTYQLALQKESNYCSVIRWDSSQLRTKFSWLVVQAYPGYAERGRWLIPTIYCMSLIVVLQMQTSSTGDGFGCPSENWRSRYKLENCLMEVWNKIDLSGEEIVIHPPEDLPKEVEDFSAKPSSIATDDTEEEEDGTLGHGINVLDDNDETRTAE